MREAPWQRAAAVGCGRVCGREWTFEGNRKYDPCGIVCMGDGVVHRYKNRYIVQVYIERIAKGYQAGWHRKSFLLSRHFKS